MRLQRRTCTVCAGADTITASGACKAASALWNLLSQRLKLADDILNFKPLTLAAHVRRQ